MISLVLMLLACATVDCAIIKDPEMVLKNLRRRDVPRDINSISYLVEPVNTACATINITADCIKTQCGEIKTDHKNCQALKNKPDVDKIVALFSTTENCTSGTVCGFDHKNIPFGNFSIAIPMYSFLGYCNLITNDAYLEYGRIEFLSVTALDDKLPYYEIITANPFNYNGFSVSCQQDANCTGCPATVPVPITKPVNIQFVMLIIYRLLILDKGSKPRQVSPSMTAYVDYVNVDSAFDEPLNTDIVSGIDLMLSFVFNTLTISSCLMSYFQQLITAVIDYICPQN